MPSLANLVLNRLWTCRVSGRVTGSDKVRVLVFARDSSFQRDVFVEGGRYTVWLKPGRYVVLQRIFNNFTRLIGQVVVWHSGEHDFHFAGLKMTIGVRNLPSGTIGGLVCLRGPSGTSKQSIDRLREFEWDFTGTPELFINHYDEIAIELPNEARRFPFNFENGGTLEIDFLSFQK